VNPHDAPVTSDRRGHVAISGNVVPLRRPATVSPRHPSCLPPYDGDADPLPLSITSRQLIASLLRRWQAGAPMTGADVELAVAMLMGTDDGGAA
jgi:hypothetical protein